MFITVVIVFAIFMLPNQVVWLWSDFGGGHRSSSFGNIVIVCCLFTYANCVSNPIIFAIFSPDFRFGFLKIFKKSSNSNYFISSSNTTNRGNSMRRSPKVTKTQKEQSLARTDVPSQAKLHTTAMCYKATTYC
jgi:hypothetical protein